MKQRLHRQRAMVPAALGQTTESHFQPTLGGVNLPSERAATQVVEDLVNAAVGNKHVLMTLETLASACASKRITDGLRRLLEMSDELSYPDTGECGLKMVDVEPLPCEVDVMARGRLAASLRSMPVNPHRFSGFDKVRVRSTVRLFGSSRRATAHHPSITRLFRMADRRGAGWISVIELQHFLEYHGHKKWAHPSYIRSTLSELGITKEPKDPIKLPQFSRYIFHLMHQDPLMEFTVRPLPPDDLMAGVAEQAKELAAILQEEARERARLAAKGWRLKRALPYSAWGSILKASLAMPRGTVGKGRKGGISRKRVLNSERNWKTHKVTPRVTIKDLRLAPRPSTAPEAGYPRRLYPGQDDESRCFGSGHDATIGRRAEGDWRHGQRKQNLETFLPFDRIVQSSLVDDDMNLRPGVTVQETTVLEEDGDDDREADPPLVRSRTGPSELQVPGRLSRSAYRALSGSRNILNLPVGLTGRATTGCSSGGEGEQRLLWSAANSRQEDGRPWKGELPQMVKPLSLSGYFEDDGPDLRFSGGSNISSGDNKGAADGNIIDAAERYRSGSLDEEVWKLAVGAKEVFQNNTSIMIAADGCKEYSSATAPGDSTESLPAVSSTAPTIATARDSIISVTTALR